MITKIRKWGSGQGLRLTRQILEDARIAIGDGVDVSTRDGMIVIVPVKRVRGGHNLKDLVSHIPKPYRPCEEDWGRPAGQEAC